MLVLVQIGCLAAFAILLIAAGWQDLRTLRIANRLSLATVASFALWATAGLALGRMSAIACGMAVAGGLIVFAIGALGFAGGISSSLRTLAGGEIENLTSLIADGRHAAIKRLEDEAQEHGAHGATGVTSDLRQLSNLNEFIAIGSAVTGTNYKGPFFTTACSGQDLYCQMDAGFEPPAIIEALVDVGVDRGHDSQSRRAPAVQETSRPVRHAQVGPRRTNREGGQARQRWNLRRRARPSLHHKLAVEAELVRCAGE